jgi:thiol-disulfide isomerase/thioredoxin
VNGPEPTPLAIGAAAPDFDLPGVDGRRYRLGDFADGKLLVVIFTCNHCPTAQAYEARIKQLVADYKDKQVRFVAISPNDPDALRLNELGYTDLSDTLEAMKIRAKDAGFNFPYLYDGETQQASRAYGPQATPHVFIFDQQRRLRYRGRVDDSENKAELRKHDAREAIEALLAGKPVAVETTKTFGCSTKWSDKRQSVVEFMEKLAKEPVDLETISADALAEIRSNKGEKLRLINVWASWCGPCVTEMPELVETDRMYRHRKFEFITVSMDRPANKPDALELLKKNQASNRNVILDKHRPYEVIEKIDPDWSGALPYTLLVEPGGKVIYRKQGAIDPIELRRAIVGKLGRTYH